MMKSFANDKRVLVAEREPDGLAVWTAYGWAFAPDDDYRTAEHFHIYDSIKEAKQALRAGGKCSCARCTTQGKV